MSQAVEVAVVGPEELAADLLVVACFEGEAPEVAGLPEPVRAAALAAAGRPGFRGKEEQVAETLLARDRAARPTDGAGTIAAVAVAGLGRRSELSWRRLAGFFQRAVDAAKVNHIGRLAFCLPGHAELSGAAAAGRVLHGIALAPYSFDRYLAAEARPARIASIALLPPPGEEATYRAALRAMRPVAAAVALARDLGNAPPNEATPGWLTERATEIAASRGIELTVLERDELARRGMGGLLAVGAGAAEPPRLLRLAWGERGPTIALVGKGVTFDSGGISIKPAPDMDAMKYDKCGACTVLAIAAAVADLGLPVRLRVYAPIAENMLDASSYRPGDIVRFANGKTAEITNTDAEGRLMLADALSLAAAEGPDAMVEFSTLTGACVVALGHHGAGLFTPDDGLAAELLAASQATGERLWRLPLWPEFLEEMKGAQADLRNSAQRWGAASTAAAFLSQFTGGVARWAHLDIAGVSDVGRDQNGHPGATGFGVALAVAWLRGLVG
ncbi:MAG TPA: leucyl aminopeptidase [Thermoanaerobaculia bacterium]